MLLMLILLGQSFLLEERLRQEEPSLSEVLNVLQRAVR